MLNMFGRQLKFVKNTDSPIIDVLLLLSAS